MKILLMTESRLDDQIDDLVTDIQSAAPEIEEVKRMELVRKTFPGFHDVLIFVGEGIEIAIIEILIKEGIKWGIKGVKKKLAEPVVISIFGLDGIPYAAAKVSSSGEVEHLDVQKMPKRNPLPTHLL